MKKNRKKPKKRWNLGYGGRDRGGGRYRKRKGDRFKDSKRNQTKRKMEEKGKGEAKLPRSAVS